MVDLSSSWHGQRLPLSVHLHDRGGPWGRAGVEEESSPLSEPQLGPVHDPGQLGPLQHLSQRESLPGQELGHREGDWGDAGDARIKMIILVSCIKPPFWSICPYVPPFTIMGYVTLWVTFFVGHHYCSSPPNPPFPVLLNYLLSLLWFILKFFWSWTGRVTAGTATGSFLWTALSPPSSWDTRGTCSPSTPRTSSGRSSSTGRISKHSWTTTQIHSQYSSVK